MHQGSIVLLNGTSSSGKSSIATAFQEIMEAPYLHTGIDHYLTRLPMKLHIFSDGTFPATAPGFLWVQPDGMSVSEIRLGPVAYRLLGGMYRAVAAFAAAGNDVIVDDVIWDQRVLKSAVEALYLSPVLFVAVRCSFQEALRR